MYVLQVERVKVLVLHRKLEEVVSFIAEKGMFS